MKRKPGSPIVNRRLMKHLKTHFNSVCSIGLEIIVYDDYNQPIGTDFAPYPNLQAIPCYKEPQATETAKPNAIVITDAFTVALAGYYPSIRAEGDIAKINERLYNIKGVTSDDTDTITFLSVEIVNKPAEVAA